MEYQVILTLRTASPLIDLDYLRRNLPSVVEDWRFDIPVAEIKLEQVSEPYDLK